MRMVKVLMNWIRNVRDPMGTDRGLESGTGTVTCAGDGWGWSCSWADGHFGPWIQVMAARELVLELAEVILLTPESYAPQGTSECSSGVNADAGDSSGSASTRSDVLDAGGSTGAFWAWGVARGGKIYMSI
jgi:hypothetical protein